MNSPIVLLGTSRLLYSCANKVREHYGSGRQITILDVSPGKLRAREPSGFTVHRGISATDAWRFLECLETPAFVLSINNPHIIPSRICARGDLTMVNLHHALLPHHPGRNAEAWTIFDEDEFGGITWHFIDEGVDTGQIIAQKRIAIDGKMTSLSLLRSCELLAQESLAEQLFPLESLESSDCDAPRSSGKHYATRGVDVPNGGTLDLDWPPQKMSAFLRAMDYGVLNVMGKPCVSIDEGQFRIRNYRIDCEKLKSLPRSSVSWRIVGEDAQRSRVIIADDVISLDLEVTA